MGRDKTVTSEELEDKYLGSLTGDDDGGGSDDDASGGAEEGQDQGPSRPADDGTGAQPDDDGGGQPTTGRQPRQEAPGQARQPRGDGRQAPREKINLTDAQQRQVYHAIKDRLQPVFNAQNRQMNQVRQENDTLKAQLKVYADRDGVAQQHKLSPLEQGQAYQLMAALKRDPVAAIKYLIDKATVGGHNVAAALGNGAFQGPSPQAIKDMVAEAVAPLMQETQQRQEYQALRNEAQQELDAFYSDFPDARVHENTLNLAMQRDPSLSLHRALFTLKSYYDRNGLDWSVPLHEYVAQNATQQQQPRPQPQSLNMRGGNGAAFEQQERQDSNAIREAPPSASFRDIVKEQMRLAGYNVSNL